MFNNEILNVVIGLVFIFLLYSLLATTIQETISTLLHRRANTLYDGINSMLSDKKKDKGIIVNFIEYAFIGLSVDFWKWIDKLFTGKSEQTLSSKFYDHPIIKNYGQNLFFKKPSYLTPENFSSILIEILKDMDHTNVNAAATFASIKATMDSEEFKDEIDAETRKILVYHLNEAAGDLDVFKYRIERWFNDTMDRVSGWYKRNTQMYLLFVGMSLAVSLNIDTIAITNYLSDNKTAREQLARMGEAAAGNQRLAGNDTLAKEALDSIKANIGKVNTLVGLGWGDYGASDTAFKNYILTDSTSEIFTAFEKNFDTAVNVFREDSIRLLSDTTLSRKKFERLSDSLQNNRNKIISQTKFALLYGNEDFENSLKRAYVWHETWSWRRLTGFLITALAISLGAPFWFDLLNKFVSLRTAVKTVNSSGSTTRNNSSDNNDVDG